MKAKRFTWWLAGVAVAAAMLVLARQFSYGVGLSGDWADYLATARNLTAGKGFVGFNGAPYLYWPPLYPLLLAAAGGGVFDAFAVAGPLNAVSWGLAVFVAGQVLRRHVANAWLVIFGCVALAVAPALGDVAAEAMSEAVFLLFVTAALTLACRYLETTAGGDRKVLLGLAAAAVASLAILTRYVGVCVALVVAPLLLFAGNAPLAARAWRVIAYVAIALAPVGLWLLRNHLLFGATDGHRRGSEFAFGEVVWAYFAEVANWVLLDTLDGWLWRTSRRGIVPVPWDIKGWLLAAGVAFIGVCLLAFAGSAAAAWARWWRTRGDLQPITLAYCVFGGFAVVYLVAVVVAQTVVELAPLGGRYALPAFPPLLIAIVLAAEMLRRRRWGEWAAARLRRVPRLVALLAIVWLCGAAAVSANRIRIANDEGTGLGLARPEWQTSATLDYIRRELSRHRFHTNNPRAVFAHTAHADYGVLERELEPAKQQIQNLPEGAHIVIMCAYHYAYTDAELRAWGEWKWLAPVSELSDGVVFRVVQPGSAPAPPAEERSRGRNTTATEWCW